jgi:hypothetical protein
MLCGNPGGRGHQGVAFAAPVKNNDANGGNRSMARQDSKTLGLAQPDPIVEEPAPDLLGRRKSKTISLAQPDAAVAVEEPVPELLGRRKRPEVGQFRLLVDRQTKASFATYEAAEKAAMAIKTGHPIVSVVVYDAKDGENHVMELAKK